MKLLVKNMVSRRCKMIVKSKIKELGLSCLRVDLGEIVIRDKINAWQRKQLKSELSKTGLILIDDPKSVLVGEIKDAVAEMIQYNDMLPKIKNSVYLSKKLKCNYNKLSNAFIEETGISIEKYIITQKVERVKDMLTTDDTDLSQISFDMNYSSVGHLSNQFKKITGLTPSSFRDQNHINESLSNSI